MFADVWRRLERYLSDTFMNKFADTITGYLEGCVAYDRNLLARGEPRDVAEYLEWRRRTVGQYIDHRMVEISLGIDLAEDILTDPLLRRLRQTDVDRTILAQDILSIRKELTDHEHENIVVVLALSEDCTISEALRRANGLYLGAMDHFDETHEKVLASHLGQHDHVRRWITALNDFHAGLLEWSMGSVRYTLQASNTWNTPDMVIDESGTTVRSV